ncbi:MAG: nuclear transport factor 2 family protein [Cyanobacteria bacterium J06576_12]
MKSLMFFFLAAFLGFNVHAQDSNDLAAIEQAVRDFASAGDQQNVEKLETVLHPQFRAVVNRLFGSEEVSLMDKAVYLQLIEAGKIGGDERSVHILQLEVVGNNASVRAVLDGKAMHFTTFMSLVKNTDGSWQVIGDFPHIQKV